MPNTTNEKIYCEKCGRMLGETEFYASNNLEKYPNNGKMNLCKKCMTMHVDNLDPSTYLWILKEADVPYIPEEWNKILLTYATDKKKVTGTTVIGRYLAKMKLKQFRAYRWADTEALQEIAEKRVRETMEKQGFSAVEIEKAVQNGRVDIPENIEAPSFTPNVLLSKEELLKDVVQDLSGKPRYAVPLTEDELAPPPPAISTETADDLGLTDEDVTYLRIKWGPSYRPDEWVRLEQFYNEMMESYDIQSAGHIDTLKLICKTSLKANQLIDMGDVDGFQKMSKTYDQLMKAGKFTAAQNKEEHGEFINSIGELVAICETEGFIPRYYVSEPKDKVDATLEDMKRYTRTLVTEELNLGNLIENAVREAAKEDAEEAQRSDDSPEPSVIEEVEQELHDDDFRDYEEFKEEQMEADAAKLIHYEDDEEG